jgi:hypothetical protein
MGFLEEARENHVKKKVEEGESDPCFYFFAIWNTEKCKGRPSSLIDVKSVVYEIRSYWILKLQHNLNGIMRRGRLRRAVVVVGWLQFQQTREAFVISFV